VEAILKGSGLDPDRTPAKKGERIGAHDDWMRFNALDLSKEFAILAFMTQGVFDNDPHRGLISGLATSLSLQPSQGNMLLVGAYNGKRFGLNKTKFQPDTWTSFGVHGAIGKGKTATFRFNGADDGTVPSPEFITCARTTEFFHMTGGKLAELRIYNKNLTTDEIRAVEAAFTASYVTPK
jgi:hypothetical protein